MGKPAELGAMLSSEYAIKPVDGLVRCSPPSLNVSRRDVARLRLCYQGLSVFFNIDRMG